MASEYSALTPHPQGVPQAVASVDVTSWRDGDRWSFRYLVEGVDELTLPDPINPGRADGLWQTTCFEAFVALDGQAYLELNFSPSGAWAAYRFDAPREGMRDEPAEVEVWLDGGETWIAVEAAVRCDALVAGSALGLSAVIEERGVKSFWALAHGDGAPDFHDRACFLSRLPE